MSALFDLDDFQETRTEWEPIYQAGIASVGWHFEPGYAIPRKADGTPITEAEWTTYVRAGQVCRDCGASTRSSAASGGSAGRGFEVCDDCTQIDGCRVRECQTVLQDRDTYGWAVSEVAHCTGCGWFLLAGWWNDDNELVPYTAAEIDRFRRDHENPRHTSRWGRSHDIDEHDALVSAQQARRARFLREVAA